MSESDPICDIIARFLLLCTAAFLRNGMVICGPDLREGRPMRRRDFMRLLGGAATTWPLGARAQQGEPLRRIGVLMSTAADDPEGQARIAAFQQGLQQFN